MLVAIIDKSRPKSMISLWLLVVNLVRIPIEIATSNLASAGRDFGRSFVQMAVVSK